ncbi:MAG: hypothetical protein ABR585_07655 [Gemmatimonadaceae bacterium]
MDPALVAGVGIDAVAATVAGVAITAVVVVGAGTVAVAATVAGVAVAFVTLDAGRSSNAAHRHAAAEVPAASKLNETAVDEVAVSAALRAAKPDRLPLMLTPDSSSVEVGKPRLLASRAAMNPREAAIVLVYPVTFTAFVVEVPVPPLPAGVVVSAPVATSTLRATAAPNPVADALTVMFVAPDTHGAVHTSAYSALTAYWRRRVHVRPPPDTVGAVSLVAMTMATRTVSVAGENVAVVAVAPPNAEADTMAGLVAIPIATPSLLGQLRPGNKKPPEGGRVRAMEPSQPMELNPD